MLKNRINTVFLRFEAFLLRTNFTSRRTHVRLRASPFGIQFVRSEDFFLSPRTDGCKKLGFYTPFSIKLLNFVFKYDIITIYDLKNGIERQILPWKRKKPQQLLK